MDHMFSGCSDLISLDLTNYKTSSALNIQYMFSGCSSLTTLDITSFDTNSVIYMGGLFYGCSSIKSLNLFKFNTSLTENMAFMFYKMKSITSLDINNFDTSNVKFMYFMFDGCESLLSLNISNFITTNIENIDNMFSGCSSLKSLDLSNFNTSSVISMKHLFEGCASLVDLDISSFDTSSVTSLEFMFSGCKSLSSLNLLHFNTSSVISMAYLFRNCSSLIVLNISNFDTTSVVNMGNMFNGCSKFVSFDLMNFDTNSVKYMDYMFAHCSSLENLNIYNFNTSSVINMAHMFEECTSLTTINLSNFVTSNIINMEYMFSNDIKLIYVNLEKMNDNNVKSMNNILQGTIENMVFCIDESTTLNFIEEINKKGCSVINCSASWLEIRKNVDSETLECFESDCWKKMKYFYEYRCYDVCPTGTIPNNFVCETIVEEEKIENVTLKESEIKKYYLNPNLKNKLNNTLKKQKFIEGSIKGLINRQLYDLAIMSTSEKKNFTIITNSEVYQIYALSNKKRVPNLTYIEFDECAKILKKKHNLKEDDDIIVFKVEYKSSNYKIPIIEYALFNSVGAVKLHLDFCNQIKLKYYIPMKIDNFEDYLYNPENKYYHDQCFSYSGDNRDLILYDRRDEFNKNNMSLCESICIFKGYIDNQIICECNVKSKINSYFSTNSDKYNLIYRFKNEISRFSFNIWVLKCYSNIFTNENLFTNKCSFVILGVLFINILGAIIFKFTEYPKLLRKLYITMEISKEKALNYKNEDKNNINEDNNKLKDNIYTIKKSGNKANIKNFKAKKTKEIGLSSSRNSSRAMMNKLNNLLNNKSLFQKIIQNKNLSNEKNLIKDYLTRTDNELNNLSYDEALIYDQRSFCQYYASLIRLHHILVFAFHTKNDYNSHIIKICFLFLNIANVLAINLLFVDDWTLHEIYLSKETLNLLFKNIPKIMYATTVSYLVKIILTWIISTEDIFLTIKRDGHIQSKKIIGKFGIICVTYFGLAIITLLFYWLYIMCFFAVFPKTQIFVLEISGISFGLLLILPVIINIIPPIFRIYSFNSKKDRDYPYRFSQFLQLL